MVQEVMAGEQEIFLSSVRSTGDLAGMLEFDGETAYFYLYVPRAAPGTRIINSIHVWSGSSDVKAEDVAIAWDVGERKVGLFIRRELWAVFEGDTPFGGNYARDSRPSIPAHASFSIPT